MSNKNTNLNTTKEQERSELHRAIWQIANDLRGSVDGWDFKQYVLGILFYRFISENLTNYINDDERRSGKKDFNYITLPDKEAEFGRSDTVKEKGFYILPSELFNNVNKNARNDANLNETLANVFTNIENSAKGTESEPDLKGLFDDLDVNSNKLGGSVEKRNQRLVKLLESIGDLRLGDYSDNTIDAFGDAYEFLMTMYASNAGKSGGEFFTPQEVSELLAEITTVGKKEVNKVYDPCCGSGSLLLKFAKVLGKENVRQGFFGQEINITTYNLCRINMFLHDINYNNFDIEHGDTLTDPKHWDDEPFDAIVSNPPYSINWEGDANPLLINDPRFSPAGVLAPKGYADFAFTMHMLSWLSATGTAAIVEFPGVLYRGRSEQKIRKYLIDNNYVDAVIQLPPDLFFGTSIATCILVLKKSKKDNKTLFIDASSEFIHGGNKNKLSYANRIKILNAFIDRKDIKHFVKVVDNKDISENDYSLVVSSYVAAKDTREIINIKILNKKIDQIIKRKSQLNISINKIITDIEGVNNGNNNVSKIEKLIERLCPQGVEFKELGELGVLENTGVDKKIVDGQKKVMLLNYVDVYKNKHINKDILKREVSASDSKIKSCSIEEGDIFITPTSETKEDIGHASVADETISNAVYSYHIMRIRLFEKNKITPYYISYLFESDYLQKQILKAANGITRFGLKKSKFESLKIPFPPLSVQEKIVNIIDLFIELKSELEKNLEEEIEARKKQYEYYRNNLLIFKENDK